MDKVEIVFNRVDEAISVMKEVAKWGIEKSLRVWPDDWLTKEELITEEAKYLNAGFKIVDILDYENGRSLALYELEVDEYEERKL